MLNITIHYSFSTLSGRSDIHGLLRVSFCLVRFGYNTISKWFKTLILYIARFFNGENTKFEYPEDEVEDGFRNVVTFFIKPSYTACSTRRIHYTHSS